MRLKRILFIILAAGLLCFSAAGQVIQGVVRSASDNHPLHNAVVMLADSVRSGSLHTLTDSLGRFTFQLNDDTCISPYLEVSHVAYLPARLPVKNGVDNMVYLTPKDIFLDEVLVTADFITHKEGIQPQGKDVVLSLVYDF